MSIVLLVVAGLALVAVGAAVTFSMASEASEAMLQRAQNHGRYAGLAAHDQGGGSGKRSTGGQPKLGNQAINAI